jgi:hypothetical protein
MLRRVHEVEYQPKQNQTQAGSQLGGLQVKLSSQKVLPLHIPAKV